MMLHNLWLLNIRRVFANGTHSISTCRVVGLEEIRFDANLFCSMQESNVDNRTENVSFKILPFYTRVKSHVE